MRNFKINISKKNKNTHRFKKIKNILSLFFLFCLILILIYFEINHHYIDAVVSQHERQGEKLRIHYVYKVEKTIYTGVSPWYLDKKNNQNSFIEILEYLPRKGKGKTKFSDTIARQYPVGSHFQLCVNKNHSDVSHFDMRLLSWPK